MLLILYCKREAMRDLVEQETRATYNLIKKERYLGGNKPGKFLTKVLKKKKTANCIEKIKTTVGDMRYRTREIAKIFQNYYGELYFINKKNTPVETEKKTGENKSFPKRYRIN